MNGWRSFQTERIDGRKCRRVAAVPNERSFRVEERTIDGLR